MREESEDVNEDVAKRGISERKTQPFVSSPWWSIEHGQALIRDPSGKFEITGAAKVNYNEKLPSGHGHMIRCLFRTPPPASALDASIEASCGVVGSGGYRSWALHILANGRVCIVWSTCDRHTKSHNAPRSVLERVEIGKVSVGVWHVAQMVIAAGSTATDFAWDIWAIAGQDRSKPWAVPAVGRQLKGCSRIFWHHVSLKGAQSEGADARQQQSLWQLQVLSKTGGLELDMWRIEPIHPSHSAAARASTRGNEGERGRPTDDEGDRMRHREHRGEAQTREIGGLEKSEVRGGGAGGGDVAEELDAHTIAQRWDVDKVQAFLATFRDEFGDEATGTQFTCFTRKEVQILTRLRRRDIPANLPQRADRRGYATSAQLRRPDGHRPPLYEPYPPHTEGRR
jgi:hypothetical protein